MDVLQLLCLWCVSGSKAPLTCVWDEERFYTAGPVPRSGVGCSGDGKLRVSIPLSWNKFTILTSITFLVFGFSTNVRLSLLISWLLPFICTKRALNYG